MFNHVLHLLVISDEYHYHYQNNQSVAEESDLEVSVFSEVWLTVGLWESSFIHFLLPTLRISISYCSHWSLMLPHFQVYMYYPILLSLIHWYQYKIDKSSKFILSLTKNARHHITPAVNTEAPGLCFTVGIGITQRFLIKPWIN